MSQREEIFTVVREVLVDALGVDDDEVTRDASLVADLGAESIDFLDIVFRLEKTLNVRVDRSELFPEATLSDPQYVVDGQVTPSGIEKLRGEMPFADLDSFGEKPDVTRLFTVDTVCRFFEQKLAERAA